MSGQISQIQASKYLLQHIQSSSDLSGELFSLSAVACATAIALAHAVGEGGLLPDNLSW